MKLAVTEYQYCKYTSKRKERFNDWGGTYLKCKIQKVNAEEYMYTMMKTKNNRTREEYNMYTRSRN